MICHFVLHPTDAAGDKKMSRGMATTFYCGSLLGGNEKSLKNAATSSRPRGG